MKARLQTAMKEALKARDKVRLETIRGVLAAIQYEEMAKETEDLPADAILAVLQREIKKRREELEYAEKASRADLKDKLLLEVSTLEGFLPTQLNSSDLEKLIIELKTQNPGINMGAVMKSLRDTHAGQFDGKMASEIAKRVLS